MVGSAPQADQLDWAVHVLGGDTAARVTGLRDGGAPWLIATRRASDGQTIRGVLRIATVTDETAADSSDRERTGMAIAARAGIPVPRVLGERTDEHTSLLLIEHVSGSSAQPLVPDARRLEALGAAAASIFAAPLGEEEDEASAPHVTASRTTAVRTTDTVPPMPRVEHPIPLVDFAALRAQAEPQPLLVEAERSVAETVVDDPVGFVHGDLWSGNTLWADGRLTAVLDWDCSGVGPAGVDLGSLRCDAAMCHGGDSPDAVLAGWQTAADRPADSVPYWDVVAALSTPPDIAWFAPAIAGMTNRPDLTADVLRERRDAFLADALRRLG